MEQDKQTAADVGLASPARACPLCGATDAAPLKAMTVRGYHYRIVRCTSCRFAYVANPRASSLSDTPGQYATILPPRRRHHQIKRLLDGYAPFRSQPQVRVVEVGAGYGPLAGLLSSDPHYEYIGFEPSPLRSEMCQQHGLDVRCELFGAHSVPDGANAVVIDNVLEHLHDPRALVADACTTLRPQGVLIIIVPSLHDLRYYAMPWLRRKHLWVPQVHINYFTPRTLMLLFHAHGMRAQSFGLDTVRLPGDWQVAPKAMLDRVGLPVSGLYYYGIKDG